uniref:Uncharacterized protein n=1 Tax=Octopus bimaculoides TaxID=37653 RepID=A0A0L8HKV3_OCTBM
MHTYMHAYIHACIHTYAHKITTIDERTALDFFFAFSNSFDAIIFDTTKNIKILQILLHSYFLLYVQRFNFAKYISHFYFVSIIKFLKFDA